MNFLSDIIEEQYTLTQLSLALDTNFLISLGFNCERLKTGEYWSYGGIYLVYWENGGWRITIGQKDCITERLGGGADVQTRKHLYYICKGLGI